MVKLGSNAGAIILATTFTCHASATRRREWDYCLRVNAENPNIEILYAFLETIPNMVLPTIPSLFGPHSQLLVRTF